MVSSWVAILPVPMVTREQAGCGQREKEKGAVRDQVQAQPTMQTHPLQDNCYKTSRQRHAHSFTVKARGGPMAFTALYRSSRKQ